MRLPIDLDLRGREALVVGATGEAVSKVERLVRAGAVVRVVEPGDVDPRVAELAAAGAVSLARRPFQDEDLALAWIVFVTPEHDVLAERLHAWAIAERRLVCTLDRTATCTFTNPAVVRADPVTIALSSDGVAPSAMRRLREDLEAIFADHRLPGFFARLRALRAAAAPAERKARMRAAVEGFGLVGHLVFPPEPDDPAQG